MNSPPHRVALVTHDISAGGGVATVVAYLHRILSDSAHYTPEIISVSISSRDPNSVRLLSPRSWRGGIQITEGSWRGLPYKHFGAHATELEFQRYQPRQVLTDYLNRFDLVQVVGGTPAWGGVAMRCRRPVALFTATTIQAERAASIAGLRGARRGWVRAMTHFNERIEKRVLRRMNCVFAESQSTLRRIQPLVRRHRLRLGPPGIDTDFFRRGDWNPQGYLLAVGRFSDPRKNVRLLLQAYALLCQAFPGAPPLILAGASPDEADLQLIQQLNLASRVEVRVDVSQDELAALYRGAGLFVLSSDEEGLGIVILEAMASALPVVSTDCGGPSTAVSEGQTGFLTPVGNASVLANAMRRILENPRLAERMGEAGWQAAQTRFSLEATGRTYLERYDELLQEQRAAA